MSKSYRANLNTIGMDNPVSKVIHEEKIQQVEKWCKALDFIMRKVTLQMSMWPKLVGSIFRYFTTDLGNDAFELPYLMW